MTYLTLFITLFMLAALWPPYNILIARAIDCGDHSTVVLIPLVSTIGLAAGTGALLAGAGIAKLPLSFLGGLFIVLLGVRMLIKRASENKEITIGERAGTFGTVFLISFMPGVFSVTAAVGIEKGDYLVAVLVFLAGPLLGIMAGGLALHHGFRATRLPLGKIGGFILIGIGLWMLLS